MEPLNMCNLSVEALSRCVLSGFRSLSPVVLRCKLSLGLLAFLALLIIPFATGQAVQTGGETSLVRAVQAMNNDHWTAARQMISKSRDPLARKLYNWMNFREEDSEPEFSVLAKFVKEEQHWPGMRTLREKAEKTMPYDLGADEVISWFTSFPPETASGVDHYVEALLIRGKNAEAKKVVSEWWAEKLSTRDEQKTIYTKYGRLIDMNAHRRRLDTLLFSKQFTNARSIAQVLGKGYPELTEARIALAEEKPGVKGLIDKVPANLQDDPGLLYERLSWRRKNDMDTDAMKILHQQPPTERLANPEDWWKERHIIIRRLLERRMFESAYLLAAEHGQKEGVAYAEAEWLAGWMALRFMKQPEKAYVRFEKLYAAVVTPISKARAAYWAGRAAAAMNQKESAVGWYQKAAKYQTTFYGQMAGAVLGAAQALPNAAPPTLTADDLTQMNANDLIRAAIIFQQAGMHDHASDFLEVFAENSKTPKAYRFAAELASRMGMQRDAVKIAKEATKEGMFLSAQAFPVITDKLRGNNTEWALVHAIIRQESMFDPGALSPAGALGLMQLMPPTAKGVSAKLKIPYSKSRLISDPSYNIRLGSKYLDMLLDRYDGSYPLAIAAYNGGPGRVSKAIESFGDPRQGQIDMIDWMELIPVSETRNYVQRVMESVYIYRLRLKGIQAPPTHAIHIAMAEKVKPAAIAPSSGTALTPPRKGHQTND